MIDINEIGTLHTNLKKRLTHQEAQLRRWAYLPKHLKANIRRLFKHPMYVPDLNKATVVFHAQHLLKFSLMYGETLTVDKMITHDHYGKFYGGAKGIDYIKSVYAIAAAIRDMNTQLPGMQVLEAEFARHNLLIANEQATMVMIHDRWNKRHPGRKIPRINWRRVDIRECKGRIKHSKMHLRYLQREVNRLSRALLSAITKIDKALEKLARKRSPA